MSKIKLINSFLQLCFASSCYESYSYPVLVGNKDEASPTETIGLCTAENNDKLYFAFLSNEKTLRAEAQTSEYTYLGYMVFSNFDTAATKATNYKQTAYIDKNPEGYLCNAIFDKFFLATDSGEVARIDENEATFFTILDALGDPISNFKMTFIQGGN